MSASKGTRKGNRMKPSIEQIREAAEQYIGEYAVVAIRTQEEPFELGEIDHLSHVWNDGEDTEEEIDGLSATTVKSARIDMHADDHSPIHGFYFGEHAAIVCGNDYEVGEDEGEVVISDPVCVHIF